MLLKEVILQNFMPFALETVTFPQSGTVSILGEYAENVTKSNGAGKSSLIEAILYALFGKSRTVSEVDMVKQGSNADMFVQLKFDFNNQEYIVKRGRTKTGGAIIFFSINGNPIGGGVRDIDSNIIKHLGINYDVFVASVFFEQNKIDSFTIATPTKRKEYLSSILDLQVYESCSNIAKQQRDQLNSELERTQAGILQLTRLKTEKETSDNHEFTIKKNEEKKVEIEKKITLSEVIVSETMSSIARFEQELTSSNELISQLAKLKNQYNGKLGSTEKIKRDIESKKIDLRDKWDRKNLLAKQLPEFEKKKEDINLEISSISVKSDVQLQTTKDSIATFRNLQGELSGNIKYLRAEIDSVVSLGANCPTCKQNIDQQMVSSLKEDKTKKIEETQLSLDGIKSQLETLLEEQRIDDKCRSKLSELKSQYIRVEGEIILSSSAKKEREELETQGKVQIESLEEMLKTSSEELEEIKKQVEESQQRVNNLPTSESTGLDSLKAVLQMRKKELTDFQVEIKKCDEFIIRAKSQLEEIQKLLVQIEQETTSIKDRQFQLQAYQDLVEMFSQKGIPAIIIENTIVEIENITNEYLSEVGSVFKVSVRSQRETKVGNMKETLDILIDTPQGIRDYSTYSGGEKTIINLCLRLALSTILSSRNKVHFDSIFLDEVISSLDEDNRENFLKLIKILGNKFSQIFIISHIQELRDIFDHSLKVVKSHSGSQVILER